MKFYRDSLLIFAATLIVNLATFAFHFAYSRALGIHGYGALYSIINVASLVTVVAGIGTLIVARIVSEQVVRRCTIGPIAFVTIRWGILAGLTVGLFMAAFVQILASFLHVGLASLAFLILFAATQMPLSAARGVLQGTQSFRPFAISLIMEAVLRTVLAIALVTTFSSLPLATAAYAAGSALALVYTCIVAAPSKGEDSGAGVLPLLETLHLSGGIVISSIAIALISTVDVILARHYLTNVESGAYAAMALVGKTLFFAMSFMPTILLPKAAQSASAADLRKLLLNAGLIMGALSALALAVFFFVPAALIRLLAGPGYESAASYVFPYGIAMAALGAANGFAAYRIGVSDLRYIPLAVTLAFAEIIGIALFHAAIGQIVSIVVAVTIGLLVAVLWGIGKARQNVFTDAPLILLQQEVEAH